MTGMVQKIRDRIEHGTVLLGIQNGLESIGINIRPYYWMREGSAGHTLLEFENDSGKYECQFLGQEQMDSVGMTEERGDNVELYRTWLKEGKKCLAISYRGLIAAYNWVAFDEVPHPWANGYRLKYNEAYLFHMYTMKESRGKRLAPRLRVESYRILRAMGRDTFYSLTSAFNRPAVHFKRRLRAKPLKLGLYIQLFKRFTWNWTLREYKD